MLTRWEESFHNAYKYRIIMMRILNNLQFYLAIISQKKNVNWGKKRRGEGRRECEGKEKANVAKC